MPEFLREDVKDVLKRCLTFDANKRPRATDLLSLMDKQRSVVDAKTSSSGPEVKNTYSAGPKDVSTCNSDPEDVKTCNSGRFVVSRVSSK